MKKISSMECGLRWLIINQINGLLDNVYEEERDKVSKTSHFKVFFVSGLGNEYACRIELYKDSGNHNYVKTISSDAIPLIINNSKLVVKFNYLLQYIDLFKQETKDNCTVPFESVAPPILT